MEGWMILLPALATLLVPASFRDTVHGHSMAQCTLFEPTRSVHLADVELVMALIFRLA